MWTPKGIKIRYLYTELHDYTYTIQKAENNSCPTVWSVNKPSMTLTIRYYSALRRNCDTHSHKDKPWGHFACEANHSLEDKCFMIPLMFGTESYQSHRQCTGSYERQGDSGESPFKGQSFSPVRNSADRQWGWLRCLCVQHWWNVCLKIAKMIKLMLFILDCF